MRRGRGADRRRTRPWFASTPPTRALPEGELALRWGRWGHEPLFCTAVGSPWAAVLQTGPRATEQLYGHVAPLGGQVSGLVDVNVTSATPARRDGGSPWAGMSGAGLVVGRPGVR